MRTCMLRICGWNRGQQENLRERAAALEAQNDELVEAMAAMVEDVYNADVAAIEEG